MEASDHYQQDEPDVVELTASDVSDVAELSVEPDSPSSSQVDAAVAAISSFASAMVTAPGYSDPKDLPPVKFDRLSVERRVLGHVTDEVDQTPLGPRNTLAAITYALMTDRNTTRPQGGQPRLETEGQTTAQIAQAVLDHLSRLVDAGLVEVNDDGEYALTDAGHLELRS